jgi:hypothetical protein
MTNSVFVAVEYCNGKPMGIVGAFSTLVDAVNVIRKQAKTAVKFLNKGLPLEKQYSVKTEDFDPEDTFYLERAVTISQSKEYIGKVLGYEKGYADDDIEVYWYEISPVMTDTYDDSFWFGYGEPILANRETE